MKNIIFCLLLIFAFSCENQELVDPEMPYGNKRITSACGTSNPLEELEWLKDQIEEDSSSTNPCPVRYVIQGNYLGETVFMPEVLSANCCGCAGSAVYNCNGELLFMCDLEKESKIKDKKEIWRRE